MLWVLVRFRAPLQLSLFKRISISVQKAWSKLQKDPYKESTTLIRDMFKDLCYTYGFRHCKILMMLMHVHNTAHLGLEGILVFLFDTKTNTNGISWASSPSLLCDRRDISSLIWSICEAWSERRDHQAHNRHEFTHWERLYRSCWVPSEVYWVWLSVVLTITMPNHDRFSRFTAMITWIYVGDDQHNLTV